MKKNKQKLNKVLTALKSDESLLDCVLEMIDTAEDEQELLKTGDDAEEAVVSVIQKAGSTLLRKWVQKKNEEAERLASLDKSI